MTKIMDAERFVCGIDTAAQYQNTIPIIYMTMPCLLFRGWKLSGCTADRSEQEQEEMDAVTHALARMNGNASIFREGSMGLIMLATTIGVYILSQKVGFEL